MNATWTLIGYGHLLGDMIDAIHENDDKVSRIIHNIDEPTDPRRLPLNERLKLINYEIPIVPLDEFEPKRERHILGFTGFKAQPLVDSLKTKFNLTFDYLIHPEAFVSKTSYVGDGCFINARAVVGPHTTIGKHTILNRLASVGHNDIIGDYSIIQPSAALAGYIKLGYGVYVGLNATIIECLNIGEKSIVAAGAVVTSDIPKNQMWAGVPARYKKDVNL